jgi:hypothetical protein
MSVYSRLQSSRRSGAVAGRYNLGILKLMWEGLPLTYATFRWLLCLILTVTRPAGPTLAGFSVKKWAFHNDIYIVPEHEYLAIAQRASNPELRACKIRYKYLTNNGMANGVTYGLLVPPRNGKKISRLGQFAESSAFLVEKPLIIVSGKLPEWKSDVPIEYSGSLGLVNTCSVYAFPRSRLLILNLQ